MKVKEKIKNNKRFLLGMLVGLLISGGSVYAVSIISKDVSYDNSSSKLTSTNVQGAIDELYKTATDKIAEAEAKCPEGYTCYKSGLCRAATVLHDNPNGGQFGTISEGILKSGVAFDCDVNGDGVYNPETERFYYISDYYNTSTKEFESDTAVLLYYNNVSGGEPNNSDTFVYNENTGSNQGPEKAMEQLPSNEQWKGIKLTNEDRVILGANSETCTNFSYSGKSARLLTDKEILSNGIINSDLKNEQYSFLFENLKNFSNSTNFWYYLEGRTDSRHAMVVSSNSLSVSYPINQVPIGALPVAGGVRPAIEVSKSDISY